MRRHRTIGWLVVGVALWTVGCAAPRVTRPIYQEGETGKAETFIRLDHAPKGEKFDHPAQVAPARLRALLASVAVQRQTGLLSVIFSEKPFRAFSDSQLDLLSAQLSKALAEAAPEEMATFYFNAPESNEQLRVTSGGAYIRQGHLVFVIANYRYTALWSDQASGRPHISPTASRDNPLYAYPEGTYQLVVGKGQERLGGEPGWFNKLFGASDRRSGVVLALDAPAAPAPVQEKAAEGVATAPTVSEHQMIMAAPVPLATNPQAAMPLAPASATAPAALAAPAVPPAIVPSPAASPLEEKLRLLKKLHDEGLITDADYEAKKQELLKGF